jgi:Tfp pilus assembly protein PilF
LQLEQESNQAGTDARTQNNLGVVKLALSKEDKVALECFEKALAAEPDHAPATFTNAQMSGHHATAALQLDRTGAVEEKEHEGLKEIKAAVQQLLRRGDVSAEDKALANEGSTAHTSHAAAGKHACHFD